MTYERKTRDIWNLYGNYGTGLEILTAASNFDEARAFKKDYLENDNQVFSLIIRCEREAIKS